MTSPSADGLSTEDVDAYTDHEWSPEQHESNAQSQRRAIEGYQILLLAKENDMSYSQARSLYMRQKAAAMANDLLAQPHPVYEPAPRTVHCRTCSC